MQLSTRGRYASRLIIQVALNQHNGAVPKKKIAAETDVTPDYMEQLLVKLKHNGLVRSQRGIKGGFLLAQPATAITLRQVLEAVGERLELAPCLVKDEHCKYEETCTMKKVWQKATNQLRDYFEGITVAELCESRELGIEPATS